MKKVFLFFLFICIIFSCVSTQVSNDNDKEEDTQSIIFKFLSKDEAGAIINVSDDYTDSLSEFDISFIMNTEEKKSIDDFLLYLNNIVLDWSEKEMSLLTKVFFIINKEFSSFSLQFPEIIYIIKITHMDPGKHLFTRGNSLYICEEYLNYPEYKLEQYIISELFHIMLRFNKNIEESLFKIISFYPCPELQFPEELKDLKITMASDPDCDYYIELVHEGVQLKFIPVIYATREFKSGPEQGLNDYGLTRFLAVEVTNEITKPLYNDGKIILKDAKKCAELYEKIGFNSKKIYFPSDIMAKNFEIMIHNRPPATPIIIEEMKKIMN